MRLWRAARAAFADLGGEGARLYGGRWNSPGRAVLYTAENPALAILEVRVHLDLAPDLVPDDYMLIEIDATGLSITDCDLAGREPRAAGDAWLVEGATALLRVPSAVAPRSFNILANPRHPDAAQLKAVAAAPVIASAAKQSRRT
jgi:RES domain-containing protein